MERCPKISLSTSIRKDCSQVKFNSLTDKIFDDSSVITSLAFYFQWVCLAGEESVSEDEEVDDGDEGKVGRIGHPKHSEIGRHCC
jgi:hypothetical protein